MDITNEHKHKLTPFKQDFSGIPLSDTTKKTLDMGIFADNDFVHFHNENKKAEIVPHENAQYIVIGDDEGTSVVIDTKTDNIYSIDFDGELPTRFINSNLNALTACLLLYSDYTDKITESTDENIEEIMDDLKKRFLQVDPQVFNDDENWWGVIFFEIVNGLR